ncbi:MAG: PxKF domain-containing protein [Terriglobales bacterium]
MTRNKWALVLMLGLAWCAALGQGDWAVATHLPGPVNTVSQETNPVLTADGLTMYFVCTDQNLGGCPGLGKDDIWIAHRASIHDPWDPPANLGPVINTSANENSPQLSAEGTRLYFSSDRNTAGSRGGSDLWLSTWDGTAWSPPVNLGDGVNTSWNESSPSTFVDPETGTTILFFYSDRAGGLQPNDIYSSALQTDGTFGPATPVAELNTSANEQALSVRHDGLEIFFISNRPGSILNAQGQASFDHWTSTRASTHDPWSQPVNVDPNVVPGTQPPVASKAINSGRHDGQPHITADGMSLYFAAAQRHEDFGIGTQCTQPLPGSQCYFDIWMTTRPDTTPPNAPTAHVNASPNAAGWNNTDATVSFTSNGDAGPIFSGVASCTANVVVSEESAGTDVSGTCTDNSGNVSAAAVATVKLDKTPPVVTVTGVNQGGTYPLGAVPSAGCDTYDGLSGVATVASLTVTGGTSNGVGTFTASCGGATDVAGTTAPAKSAHYSVSYMFGGFLAPLAPGAWAGDFKLGSTIPVKWQLGNANGGFISSLSSVQSLQIAFSGDCGSYSESGAVDPGSSGTTGLRYDATGNQFVFNWQTRGLAAGCYSLVLKLDDGSVHSTAVNLR